MLKITIPETECYDEVRGIFVKTKEQKLHLEHSLVSLSKWEAKWKKPFLSREPHSMEETLDYIRCMTITQNVDPDVYYAITPSIVKEINDYIEDSMTATWFNDKNNQKPNREVITAEIIYYWMISLQIPIEFEKWHLNRLLTLIRVCNIKNAPEKKMSKRENLASRKMLNDARRKRYGTRG